MDSSPYDVLKDMFRNGVIRLRELRFRQLPFRIDYVRLETNPTMRNQVFQLLSARMDARAYDAVTSSVDDCRYLSAIYADRCGLPFIIPEAVKPSNQAPMILYGDEGDMPKNSKLVMVNAYNRPFAPNDMENHPFVRVLNVLQANGYRVEKIISIFDADREHSLRRYLASLKGQSIAYETIFAMRDVFRMLKSAPQDFDLKVSDIDAAIEHYERNPTIVPPSSII